MRFYKLRYICSISVSVSVRARRLTQFCNSGHRRRRLKQRQ